MAGWITNVVESMGYIGIAFLMFLENVFPPIPSELIMPFAGFTTARGDLTFVGVVIAGTVGSVVGQLPLYYAGRVLGEHRLKRWADRYGQWLAISSADIERADAWFDKRGGAAILVCRLIPGIRSLISIPAGIQRMNLLKFLFYSTIGMGVWATGLAWAGRVLGQHYDRVEHYVGPATYVVLGGVALLVLLWAIRRKRRQTKSTQR